MSFRSRTCRGCGCTYLRACPGGCSWVLLDAESPTGICSTCAQELDWDPRALIEINVLAAPEHVELIHPLRRRPA